MAETLPTYCSDADRAALAFSLLSSDCAEDVNRRLTLTERQLLREGLSRTRGATDHQRMEAMRALARAVRRGMEWPRPAAHDEADCPFTAVGIHPRFHVLEVLERVAQRDPLQVAVTLCHLGADIREELWSRMEPETLAVLTPRLHEVHLVSTSKTRDYARDINTRLNRAIRFSGRSRAVA